MESIASSLSSDDECEAALTEPDEIVYSPIKCPKCGTIANFVVKTEQTRCEEALAMLRCECLMCACNNVQTHFLI